MFFFLSKYNLTPGLNLLFFLAFDKNLKTIPVRKSILLLVLFSSFIHPANAQ